MDGAIWELKAWLAVNGPVAFFAGGIVLIVIFLWLLDLTASRPG